jgi:hypothetical protein
MVAATIPGLGNSQLETVCQCEPWAAQSSATRTNKSLEMGLPGTVLLGGNGELFP